MLLTPITDLLLDFRLATYLHNSPDAVAGGLRHHRNILARVRTRDAAGARQAMYDHLAQVRGIFEAIQRAEEQS